MKTIDKTGTLSALRGLAVVARLASFIALPAFADDAPGDKVVATINGTPITEGDLGAAALMLGDRLQQVPADRQRSALLNFIIEIRLVAKAAETAGIDKNKDVAQKLALAHDQTLRAEYLKSKVIASVTDDAAKKRFDEELAKFVAGDEIHVFHILVNSEAEAKAVIADLDKGGDFSKIAKEKSNDRQSAERGGDLDFIGRGKGSQRTLKQFEDAAFAIEIGAYSKSPVQSDYGWHVIKVTEKRKQPPPTFEAEGDRIRQEIARETVTNELQALRAAAKIEIVPDAPPAAPAAPATPPPADQAAPAQPAR